MSVNANTLTLCCNCDAPLGPDDAGLCWDCESRFEAVAAGECPLCFEPKRECVCSREAAVYGVEGVDFVVRLPKAGRVPNDFVDRCGVARAESYRRQQERNARFEHLRRLLCKPEPVAEPTDWAGPVPTLEHEHQTGPVWVDAPYEEERWVGCEPEELGFFTSHADRCVGCGAETLRLNGLARCDVCAYEAERRQEEEPTLVSSFARPSDLFERGQWVAADTPDAVYVLNEADATRPEPVHVVPSRYADGRQSAVHTERIPSDEHHHALVDLLHADLAERRRVFREDQERRDERNADRPRPTAQITVNVKTGWVTYTSSQAKARVTLNLSTRRLKLSYQPLPYKLRELYSWANADAEKRDAVLVSAAAWLERQGVSPNVASALTQKADHPLATARRWRDQLAREGVPTNVRIIR